MVVYSFLAQEVETRVWIKHRLGLFLRGMRHYREVLWREEKMMIIRVCNTCVKS